MKMWLEPRLDPIFRDDSWVVEFDIRGLFDNLAHDLLMAALRKHCQEPWR